MPRPRNTPQSVFDRLVLRDNGCLEWPGRVNRDGYARVRLEGKSIGVHRLIFQWVNGEIPSDWDVHHKCFNRRCANPEHLKAVYFLHHRWDC